MRFLMLLLACVSHGVLAHSGHVNQQAVTACEGKKKSDPCSYTVHDTQKYIGTCQAFSKALMCVRNQPIENLQQTANAKAVLLKQYQLAIDVSHSSDVYF
ncbi:hypothetical protein [Alteromonas sp. C1M14]|uniref:hypothetical protein n=1 Tax=Alteromonas sp. C1M14 TaxID=2841567 RepID=UPI001C08D8D8|nr:hypothetical protein [Alteromonas sp. C1M14]MBU2976809.1 hypothetical protein [Alteromonas sp. C1M14]